jgi:hypothetical protein
LDLVEHPTPAEQRIRELFEAMDAGDMEELVDGIHPAAELRPITANGNTLRGHEGTTAWLTDLERRDAQLRHLIEQTIPLDDERVVVVGRQQRFEPATGLSDRPVVYLLQLRDGLLWRGESCASVEDAFARAGEAAA